MTETKKRLLLSKWRGAMTSAREKIEELQEQVEAHDSEVVDLINTLESVRWWMHEPLVLHLPMRDPRKILRQIEDVLG